MPNKFDVKTVNKLIGVAESYQAPDALMKILFDKEQREKLFRAYLDIDSDVDTDKLSDYFMDVQADRKEKKQDFTPNAVTKLLSQIVGSPKNGEYYEVGAGTGAILVSRWDQDRKTMFPWEYYPSMFFYHLEELSDAAIPFLIFNCMIRGMNATIIHGDTLQRTAKQVYFIQNDKDDFLGFSNLNVMPHSETVRHEFEINEWTEDAIDHIESTLDGLGPAVTEQLNKITNKDED